MENLCQLKKVFREIYQFESELKVSFGASVNEIMTLCSLSQKQFTSGELAKELGVSAGRMSKIISNLEKQNFVKRIIGKEDKRQMYFDITSKGNTKISEVRNSRLKIPVFN